MALVIPARPNLVGFQKSVPARGNDRVRSAIQEFIDTLPPEIPTAAGWKLVVAVFQGGKQTKGGIWLPDETLDREHTASQHGLVMEVGPLAFQQERFKDLEGNHRPLCKVGDWVMFPMYQGQRIKMPRKGGRGSLDLRIINDDDVMATLDNPSMILGEYLEDEEEAPQPPEGGS